MMNLDQLQSKLKYTFKDMALLKQALTHRSKHKHANNERLEFLGDAILSVIISDLLFTRYPDEREGELSRLRAAIVKGETISKIALSLGLDQVIQMGYGEKKSGGAKRESILAGAFEAVIGAIYKDADLETVRTLVLDWYGDHIDNIASITDVKDAKTCLQEWLQAQRLPLPIYEVSVSGRAHAQVFDVTCTVEGFSIKAYGQSSTRRKAEQLAAKQFLEQMND